MNPEQFLCHTEYFDKIMGTAKVRKKLEGHRDVTEIIGKFSKGLIDFDNLRKPHLLY
jgi:uncharacterized protein YbbC (DUF1343 family)